MARKWRQIDKFLEVLDHALDVLPAAAPGADAARLMVGKHVELLDPALAVRVDDVGGVALDADAGGPGPAGRADENVGGLAVLDLEGLWTRYEDPEPLVSFTVATYNIHKGVRGMGFRKRLEIHNLGLGIEARSRACG